MKPGRKSTGRIRKPLNLTLPEPLKKRIAKEAFQSGCSVSRWFQDLVERELKMPGAKAAPGKLPERVEEEMRMAKAAQRLEAES